MRELVFSQLMELGFSVSEAEVIMKEMEDLEEI